MLRSKLPKVQISIISNVESVHDHKVLLDLFNAGLNFIHADTYTKETKECFLAVLGGNKEELRAAGIRALWFRKGGINIWGYHGGREKIILLSDESEGFNVVGQHIIRNIHTWAGNLPYNRWERYGIKLDQFPMLKKCTEPMKCAPIDIHGRVTLCCADSAKSVVYGDLHESTMDEIWNGENMQKVRFVLARGRRDIIPACYFCNRPSFRIGLWPYKGPSYKLTELKKEFFQDTHISKEVAKLFRLLED